MLVLVEVLDILTENRAEAERTKLRGQGRGRGAKDVVLYADGDHGDERDDEEPA